MDKMKDLVIPVVNLNGTDARSLVEQSIYTIRMLRDVEDALLSSMPHGRDYRNVDDFKHARDAWHDRRVAIRSMISEFETYAVAIQDQEFDK